MSKRDKIIITEREDHIRSTAQLHGEIEGLRAAGERSVAVVEHDYELRLAQEALYSSHSTRRIAY